MSALALPWAHNSRLTSRTRIQSVAGWLASRAVPPAPASDPELRLSFNIVRETWGIISAARASRTVFLSILGISWFWFYGATFLVQIPSYSQNVLGGDENLMSTLLAVFIVGISTGSLLCERLSGKQVEIGLVPFGAIGLTLFGLDLFFASPSAPTAGITAMEFLSSGYSWRIILDLLLIGIFGGFYIVPLYALVQQRSEVSHRSRVIAGNNILNALFMVGSALMTMALLAAGVPIVGIFAVVGVLTGLVLLWLTRRVPEFAERFRVRFRGA